LAASDFAKGHRLADYKLVLKSADIGASIYQNNCAY
jgi:hypothetical protein